MSEANKRLELVDLSPDSEKPAQISITAGGRIDLHEAIRIAGLIARQIDGPVAVVSERGTELYRALPPSRLS